MRERGEREIKRYIGEWESGSMEKRKVESGIEESRDKMKERNIISHFVADEYV